MEAGRGGYAFGCASEIELRPGRRVMSDSNASEPLQSSWSPLNTRAGLGCIRLARDELLRYQGSDTLNALSACSDEGAVFFQKLGSFFSEMEGKKKHRQRRIVKLFMATCLSLVDRYRVPSIRWITRPRPISDALGGPIWHSVRASSACST
jgi:hypothetical protein